MAHWIIKNAKVDCTQMAKALRISPITAKVLVNRGIRNQEDALDYLNPDMSRLPDSLSITAMPAAIETVLRHILCGGSICVYGDYDVDGVMSAVILTKVLDILSPNISYYVPERQEEGYGLNPAAIEKIAAEGVSLILTCDNGIAAAPEAALIYRLGMELVIIDHHEPPQAPAPDGTLTDRLPRAEAIVDPKQASCAYPFKQMCAAGLCWRFADALITTAQQMQNAHPAAAAVRPLTEYRGKNAEKSPEENLALLRDELLSLAAIATVCDIVDLSGDNRILVKNGLEKAPAAGNLGLQALLALHKLDRVSVYHAGFVIGPTINASGRLSSARDAFTLFRSQDPQECAEIAQRLYALNNSRKEMTEAGDKRLSATLSELPKAQQKIYVLYDESVHESIAGIVAGRIKERHHHPTIVITKGDQCAKGSARSIEGYNIFEALSSVSDLFLKFGGHAQAAGFSLPVENVEPLRQRLNEACTLPPEAFVPKIYIDAPLTADQLTFELLNQLERLQPFGKGNHEPIFGQKGVRFSRVDFIGKNQNILKLWLKDNPALSAISFGGYEQFLSLMAQKYGVHSAEEILRLRELEMDIVYKLSKNEFRGSVSIQLLLEDFR